MRNHPLKGDRVSDNLRIMSAAQIIAELPKLNREQRSKILRKLRELEERDELQFMTEATELAFVEMDRREAEDAKRKSR